MRRPRILLLILLTGIFCACSGPSLKYRKEVSNLMAGKNFEKASATIQKNKNKQYGQKNAVLYQLDLALSQQAAYDTQNSLENFTKAQDINEQLFTKSISAGIGSIMINDNTLPYKMTMYEQAFTYFFTALNYLAQDNLSDSAVEMRKAVFFLDNYRQNTKKSYNDEPFVQYFASMIFEDIGQLSSARIARTNAYNAYNKLAGEFDAKAPSPDFPSNYQDLGELVFFHFSGKSPIKISNQISVGWDKLGFVLNSNNSLQGVDKQFIDSVYSGSYGRAIAISYPSYVRVPYMGVSSALVLEDGTRYITQTVADLASAAELTLKEDKEAIWARTATRAVTKFILSKQAHDITKKNTDNDTVPLLVDILTGIFNTVTEQADTRSWFLLPAQIKMTNIFLEPGEYNIDFYNYDAAGTPIDKYSFEKVKLKKGKRTYLWHYSSK